MNIIVKRVHKSAVSTIGEMYIDGVFECYTLEDVERPVKVYGKTAIPKGSYKVGITMSNRFKKMMPILYNVPNFEGVRIHSGNKAEDTEGCILVGETRGKDFIFQSKIAYSKLFDKMENAIKLKQQITITIE